MASTLRERVRGTADGLGTTWIEGYRLGYETGKTIGRNEVPQFTPYAQSEWDEAHYINYGVAVLDQMRANTIAGAPFVLTDEGRPPYEVSCECHDLQFDDNSCPCGCGMQV